MTISREALVELELYIQNDGTLYDGVIRSITTNLDKKVRAGKYDGKLAPIAWMHAVDEGARRWSKDYGDDSPQDARQHFPTDLRKKIAEDMARAYEADARSRGLRIDDNRHLCNTCAHHEKVDLKRERTGKVKKMPTGYAFQWDGSGTESQALKSSSNDWNHEVVGGEEVTGPIGSRRIDGAMFRIYRGVQPPYHYYASNLVD